MAPQKQTVSGKTVYLVEALNPIVCCESCHFWNEHQYNYDLNNGLLS